MLDRPLLSVAPAAARHTVLELQFARDLIHGWGFRKSAGFPFWSEHWRLTLSDGSCLHIVIDGATATMHHDRHDPDRDLGSLLQHVLVDAPIETAISIFAGCAILALLKAA